MKESYHTVFFHTANISFCALGRVIYRRIGGGVYREHYMLDSKRRYIPETETIEEKVSVNNWSQEFFYACVGEVNSYHTRMLKAKSGQRTLP